VGRWCAKRRGGGRLGCEVGGGGALFAAGGEGEGGDQGAEQEQVGEGGEDEGEDEGEEEHHKSDEDQEWHLVSYVGRPLGGALVPTVRRSGRAAIVSFVWREQLGRPPLVV